MKRFLDIFASDGYKISKMKSLYIGIAVMALLVFVSAIAIGSLTALVSDSDTGSFDPETGTVTGVPEDTINSITSDYGISMLAAAPSSAGALLLVAIIAALFMGAEYSSGMMRLYVGRGAGKMANYLSKLLWVFFVGVLYVCVAYLFCLIAASALGVTSETLEARSADIAKSFGSYIFYSMVFSAMFTAILHILRSKAGGIATLLAMYVIFGAVVVALVQFALGTSAVLEGSEEAAENLAYLYLDPYFTFDNLGKVASATHKDLWLIFGGGAMWGVAFSACGLLFTAKTDIK